MSKIKKNKNDLSFEEHLIKTKEIVGKLESGECNLDELLILYEDGLKSLKFCNERLNDFEDKIEIIKQNLDNSINSNES